MADDDRYALAAITARALALGLQAAAARLPLTATQGQSVRKTVYIVSALLAPAIRTPVDVAAIAGLLATAADTVRAAAPTPQDAAPVLYDAANACSIAAPTFRSPARTHAGGLSRMLAECLEATWLGEAFVAEAQTDFGDRPSAVAARKRIATAMDAALDRIAAASVGLGVIDLLGSIARTATDHIATVAADLRPIVRVQSPRSAPSTAIAYDLYEDPAQAIDLVSRNKVSTPLFMPTTLDALAPS